MSAERPRAGGQVEQRLRYVLDSSSGTGQKRADGLLDRAAQTVRRGSIVLAVGWLGLVFFAVAWVMFNLAMHGWVAARWSVITAHFVAMGINLVGGGILILVAALLTPNEERKSPQPTRDDEAHSALLAAPEPGPAEGSIESAIGSAIELGLVAAQTIPQIVRAFRKPRRESGPQTKD